MIRLNFKTCANVDPWYLFISGLDLLLLVLATSLLSAAKPLVTTACLKFLVKRCDNSAKDLKRASEYTYDCFMRLPLLIWTAYDVLLAPQCSYLVSPALVMQQIWDSDIRGTDMPLSRRLLLLTIIARYAAALVDVLFIAEKRRDALSLAIHHVVAIFMMTTAYSSFPELGLSVFLIHEVCDPFLELAKVFHYLQTSKRGRTSQTFVVISEFCFALFVLLWFTLRVYLYPVRGMYPGTDADPDSCHYGSYAAAAFFGALLYILNVVWTFMIIRALVNRYVHKRMTDETMDHPSDYNKRGRQRENGTIFGTFVEDKSKKARMEKRNKRRRRRKEDVGSRKSRLTLQD